MIRRHDHVASPAEAMVGCLVLVLLLAVVGALIWLMLVQPVWIVLGFAAAVGIGVLIGRASR